MMQIRPKVCVECRYCKAPGSISMGWVCNYYRDNSAIDIVTGEPQGRTQSCRDMRFGDCGQEGKFWMPRKPIEVTK